MVLDGLLQLANAQAVTATAVSTNVYDGGATVPIRQFGSGNEIGVLFAIGVAADFTTGDETYEFEVIQSATANMASPTVIARQPVVATLLTAGAADVLPIPPGYPTQEFIAVNIVTGGTTPSLTYSAYLGPVNFFSQLGPNYKSGFFVAA